MLGWCMDEAYRTDTNETFKYFAFFYIVNGTFFLESLLHPYP